LKIGEFKMDRTYLLKKHTYGMQNWCSCFKNTFALGVGFLIVLPFWFFPWQITISVMILIVLWLIKNREYRK